MKLKLKLKKLFLIFSVALVVSLSSGGCINSSAYNEMTEVDDKWLIEQVEQGHMTKEEAMQIWYERNHD